jgi:hypothetical protein
MPSQICLENIKKEQPPANRPCTPPWCTKVSEPNEGHCKAQGLPVDTPIVSWDPDLFGPGQGGSCYCCCSCFAANTPIEVAPGEYALIQEINAGDLILAAGPDLKWKPARVESRSGDVEPLDYPRIFMVYFQYPGDPEPRTIFVTADHLFMTPEKQLIPVQQLAPDENLLTADNQTAKVIFVAPGHLTTQIQSIMMEGKFDGKDLGGHLLNANGLVTTDYKVQVYYETEHLDANLLVGSSSGKQRLRVGTQSAAYDAFLTHPEAWPKGFEPVLKPLVNIPINAHSFLTQEEAEELAASGDEWGGEAVGTQLALRTFQYMKTADKDGVIYLLDPYNMLPNAYSFLRDRQRFVVVTGGLARVNGLYWQGMSLIVSAMRSYFKDGIECVGQSDYYAIAEDLRLVWYNDLYMQCVDGAIEQMQHLFSYIKKSGGGGEDVCRNPSVTCRMTTYKNARMDGSIPDCAKPKPHYFELVSAVASRVDNVQTILATFNDAVEQTTGGTKENYSVHGAKSVQVFDAKVRKDPRQVTLTVSTLEPDVRYMLVAKNIVSQVGQVLDPRHDSVIVSTLKAAKPTRPLAGTRK